MKKEKQFDLFENDYSNPRLFNCVAGVYIGRFNGAEDNPTTRLSEFYVTKKEAQTALESGVWNPPELAL